MNTCTAGFAKLDITPPMGVQMAGYYNVRIADGVWDPLYVRAAAFGQGNRTAVLLICDLLNIRGSASFEWPVAIAKELGLPEEAVFLGHTHTHTGPEVGDYRRDEMYDAWLMRRICDAARLAMADRKPVIDVRTAETTVPGLTFVRRFRAQDGHVQTWAHGEPDLIGPAHAPDESLRLIRILRGDAPEVVLVNFQVHPDMIGGTKISADFPGELCRRIERERPEARCIFLQGAEGELVPWDMMRTGRPGVGDQVAYDFSMGHGIKLAQAVLDIYDQSQTTGEGGLGFAKEAVRVKTKWDPALVPEADRILKQIEAGKGEELTQKWNVSSLKAAAKVQINLDMQKQTHRELPVTVLAFCGVALAGIPGELFSQAGTRIREQSLFPVTCVCSLINGRGGYYATAEAYEQGGYEPANCDFVSGTTEQLQESAVRLMNGLR